MGEQTLDRTVKDHQTGDGSIGGLFTYYAYRDSFIHRLDPRTKSLWLITGLLYIFFTDDWRLLLLIFAINLLLLRAAGFNLAVLYPVFRALVMFGLVIFVFQLLFQSGEVFFFLGPIKLHTQGFLVTRRVWLRLANLSLLFLQLMMWTHPTDLALMWGSFGLPYRYAMLGGLALRFVPIFQREVVSIQEAQQVRGQPLHTTMQRIAGSFNLLLPFMLRVLRRIDEITLSMELRGFGHSRNRTYLRSIGLHLHDWLIIGLLLILSGVRIFVLLGAF